MQRILAMTWLTWKAAFRFRLFLLLTGLLLAAVIGLPILIKDDGTARGFTQILITYTLGAITALLGLSTLWLACGILARDIEDCQIQVLVTKPIARWQIWLGKWLGILFLNAALLAISGAGVYGLLKWRSTRLSAPEQKILREEVLVARGSAREANMDSEIDQETDRILHERQEKNPVPQGLLKAVRKQIREQIKAQFQVVPPGYSRPWQIDLGRSVATLRDRPMQLRVKFNSADKSPSGTFGALFRIGVPKKTRLWQSEIMSLSPDSFHEFQIPPNLFDENGVLTIAFVNPNETALLFPLDEGMEVLYPQGGFGGNFIRGLGIIFCWMALLAALGLTAASLLSFPVAAFFSLAVLTMALSTGTLSTVVEQGTIADWDAEKGTKGHTPLDIIIVPAFQGALKLIGLARDFSPVDSLSTGRTITYGQLGRAIAQIIVLLGGCLAAIGISIFSRRELATAQTLQ
jgi:hypothetical protein